MRLRIGVWVVELIFIIILLWIERYLRWLLESSSHWGQLGVNSSPKYVRRVPHARKSTMHESCLRLMYWRINQRHIRRKPQSR